MVLLWLYKHYATNSCGILWQFVGCCILIFFIHSCAFADFMMAPKMDDLLQSISVRLNDKNYTHWNTMIKNFLKGKRLWDYVSKTVVKPEEHYSMWLGYGVYFCWFLWIACLWCHNSPNIRYQPPTIKLYCWTKVNAHYQNCLFPSFVYQCS